VSTTTRRRRLVATALAALTAAATAGTASAAVPHQQTSSDRVIFSVVEGPAHVVRGTSPDYKIRAETKQKARLQYAKVLGCDGGILDLGTIGNGQSREATCTLADVQPGDRLSPTLLGLSQVMKGLMWTKQEAESLHLDQAIDVIDPRIEVEVLPTGTWYSGLQLAVPVRITNTGDIGLKDLEFQFSSAAGSSCPGVPNSLDEGASVLMTCYLSSPGNPANPVPLTVTAKGRPDTWGTVHPANYKATSSVQRTFDVVPSDAGVAVSIYNQRPKGWAFGTYAKPSITVRNTSAAPARLSTTSPSGHHPCARADLGVVAPGDSRTYTCDVFVTAAFTLRITGTARIMDGTTPTSLTGSQEAQAAFAANPLHVDIGAPNGAGQVSVSVTNVAGTVGGNQAWNLSWQVLPGCTNAALANAPTILTTATHTFTCTLPPGASQVQLVVNGIFNGMPFRSTTTRLITGQPASPYPPGGGGAS